MVGFVSARLIQLIGKKDNKLEDDHDGSMTNDNFYFC
jgi:hypothetical protein